ncbi:MAG: flagellar assembly protein FliX [Rhodospirillales bacterium]
MKVSNIGPAKGVDKAKRKSGAASSDAFADDLRAATTDAPEQASGTVGGNAVAGVGAVLAVQAADDATQGRSKGLLMARGDRLLDRLEDLQMALLTGRMPKEKVIELAQALREKRPTSDDSDLNALIDEIELRAEVELAKLTR